MAGRKTYLDTRRAATALSGALAGAAVLSGLPGAARAQNQPVRLSPVRSYFDIFAGNDKPGPYTLSWNKLRVTREEPVTVLVDGKALRDDAFTVDAAKGTITFKDPLKAASVARVTYSYDPAVAQRNGSAASAPLTVPLTKLGGMGLSVTALPNGVEGGKDPAAGGGPGTPLVWGLGGKTALLGGGLESKFSFAGVNGTDLRLGYRYGGDRNGLSADFLRTDKTYAKQLGQRLGAADPAQRLSLGARLTPAKWLGANYASVESRDLAGNGSKETDTLALRIGGTPGLPTLNLTRVGDVGANAKGDETRVNTDKLDLNAPLGKTTTLTATGQQVATDAPAEAADARVKDGTLSITTRSADKNTQASVTLGGSTKETPATIEDRQNLALKIQPAPVFSVSAEKKGQTVTPIKDGKEQPATSTTTQTAAAEISPMPGTKITTALSETVSATEQSEVKVSSTDVQARVGEGKAFEVITGVTNRSTEAEGQLALDTTHAKLALRPTGNLTLTGGYTWNPFDPNRGRVDQALRQEFGMKARVGTLEFGSAYSLTTLNGPADKVAPGGENAQFGEVSLTLGLRFNAQTQLSGTYKDSLRYRSADDLPVDLVPRYSRIYGLDFKRELGSDLSLLLGGSYAENRALDKDPKEIKAQAKLGVRF